MTDDSKILHLYSVQQLAELPQATLPKELEAMRHAWTLIDWEALEKEYDGVELHLSEEEYDFSGGWFEGLYFQLYGWDCDSILIFHDDVIVVDV